MLSGVGVPAGPALTVVPRPRATVDLPAASPRLPGADLPAAGTRLLGEVVRAVSEQAGRGGFLLLRLDVHGPQDRARGPC
jgi:hypothetical protein